MSSGAPSTEVQRIRAYNFVKEKSKKWFQDETGRISQKFDKLVTSWQGYDKMRSRILPRGLSTMITTGDDEEEGPFSSRKRAERAITADHDEEDEICGVIRSRGRMVRKMSCPTAEFNFFAALDDNPNEFLSLPPIPVYTHDTFTDAYEPTRRCATPEVTLKPERNDRYNHDDCDQKLVIKPRRHSLFTFSPTDTLMVVDKDSKAQPRRSLTAEEEPLLSIVRDQRVELVSGRRGSTKRKSKKKKILSTETGAIMPAVLLTYQGGLFLGECESQLQNSTADYRISVC